jgi:acyl carrier protein
MDHKREELRGILDDEAAFIAWFVALARATPDVYMRTHDDVRAGTHLRDGLGIDSIGRLCVFYGLVDALGIDEDESAVAAWTTVGDVLAYLRARLDGGA